MVFGGEQFSINTINTFCTQKIMFKYATSAHTDLRNSQRLFTRLFISYFLQNAYFGTANNGIKLWVLFSFPETGISAKRTCVTPHDIEIFIPKNLHDSCIFIIIRNEHSKYLIFFFLKKLLLFALWYVWPHCC